MIEKFPESQLQAGIESHWQDSATLIFSNWLASLVDNSDRLSS
jgi:homoserine trans-succinylase